MKLQPTDLGIVLSRLDLRTASSSMSPRAAPGSCRSGRDFGTSVDERMHMFEKACVDIAHV